MPPTRASGRAAVKHRRRLARSVLPLKRDIGGCGGVYPGGNAATAAGRPYSGPSASLQWGRKIKHKREANRIARSAAARVSLRSRARPQAGNAEWTRGPGRGEWRGRGGCLRSARVVGRALRAHVTTGNLGGEGRGRERARPARRPLLPGWALNPGRGRRAGGRECVCLSRVIYGGAAGASAEEAAAAAASCNCGSLHLLSLFAP